LLGLVVAAAAGCGRSDAKIVEVTGTLTYKGNPIANAEVHFVPEQGRPSWGQTDEQGRFKLNYERGHDGAVVGKHKVFVRPVPARLNPAAEPGKAPPIPKDQAEFFDKYSAAKSTVEVEIDKNTKEVKLEWD
jgi:hypothetical protein